VVRLPAWKDCSVRWRIREEEVVSRKDRRGTRAREGVFPLSIEDEAGEGVSPAQERACSFLMENESIVLQIVLVELAEFVRDRYFRPAVMQLDDPDRRGGGRSG
jgi:hypothetical protein